MEQPKNNQSTSFYRPGPFIVTHKKGLTIAVADRGRINHTSGVNTKKTLIESNDRRKQDDLREGDDVVL